MTAVNTLRQALPNLRVATATLLACAATVYFHPLSTGSFGLVSEGFQKAVPAGIGNRTGKPVVPEHPADVQAFHCDCPVATDQLERSLVPVVVPATHYPGVQSLEATDRLSAVSSTLTLAADRPAQPSKFRNFLLEESGIRFVVPVRGREKILKTNIYADRRETVWCDLDIAEVTGQHDEPLARFPFESRSLDRSLDGSVSLAANRSHMLHPEPVVGQPDAVAVGGEFNRIVPVGRTESGIAGLLSCLDATEEVRECLIEAAHRPLSAAEIGFGEPFVGRPLRLEPCGLLAVSDALFVLFP
jgi:hypothetical protein